MLELKNLPEGALTGPPKVIYDMLIELRNSLLGEQDGDNSGLDRMCLECTSTINEYKSKVENLKKTMADDATEADALNDNMAALQGTVTSAGQEVERLSFLLQFMDNSHRDQLEGIDALVTEAQDVRDALMQARALIAANLQATGPVLLQTASGANLSNKLAKVTSTFKGYATLALEFMELASNQDIVSDQGMVAELLAAFDELINQVNADMTALQTRRSGMVASYSAERQPVEDEARAANGANVAAKTALSAAQGRLQNLMEKVEFDQENLDSWTQFVVDEGVRCQNEEASYNTRIEERYCPCYIHHANFTFLELINSEYLTLL